MSAKDVAIVGVADVALEDGRVATPLSPLGVQAVAARAALAQAGLDLAQVDGLATTGTWGIPGSGQVPTQAVAEYLGIDVSFADSTSIGGASSEAQLGHVAMALQAGRCKVALITYGSTQRSDRARSLAGRPPTLANQWDGIWGMLTPIGGHALAAQRYLHQSGATGEDLARVAVAARAWAGLNPDAMHREPLSVDEVLGSEMLSDPLHRLDCCLQTDGGGAVVVVAADRAADLPVQPVWLRGWGEAHTHTVVSQMPDLTDTPASRSGPVAMGMAGIGHDDVGLAMIYDSFTITVLLSLEALGFCDRGEAPDFIRDGRISPGGEFPINTAGGGLSHCHPGMYGIFLLIEAVRQLRGQCGLRQLPDLDTVLVNGTGGILASAATCVLSNA